jgi:hypothetical protein
MFGMRANERSSQAGQCACCFIGRKQLIGVGPSIMSHGDCLTTPDQLGATGAKIAPAPDGQLRRPSILGAVPALHWQDAEAISDIEAVKLEGACERSVRAVIHFGVESDFDTQLPDSW